jgi:hypothetical protein
MIILDLFAGLGGERRRAEVESRGHKYVTLDLDPRFNCTVTADILTVTANDFKKFGHFDFIWASPPCEAFSVASIGHHWGGGARAYIPKTKHAVLSQKIVQKTISLIKELNPSAWLIENPRGVLRKLPVVSKLPRTTVTYCQYGDKRMKPTDLWGSVPGWNPRPMCKNGDKCHEAAPRGAKTGTQGVAGAAERAVVPWELWDEILKACENGNLPLVSNVENGWTIFPENIDWDSYNSK